MHTGRVGLTATARSVHPSVPLSVLPHTHPHDQTWWTYFANRTRADGDGRPIALTLSHARNAVVRALRIHAQPFWCNTVADSADVLYDGMACNATNTNAAYAGMKCVQDGCMR
jgi:polygalacturonase